MKYKVTTTLQNLKNNSIGFYQKNEFILFEKSKIREFVPMYLNMQPIIAEINLENCDWMNFKYFPISKTPRHIELNFLN